MRINFIKKKYRLYSRQKKYKTKNKVKKTITNYIKLFFICILIIIYFNMHKSKKKPILNKIYPNVSLNETIESINETSTTTTTIKKNIRNFEYFCCFCAMGKKENLYSRELISYYSNLGVEKFIFGDNNDPNTEKLSDVLQDYINNGTVDIIDIIGSSVGQSEFYGILYEKYKKRCEWLTFFDFDEYLVMHFEEGKNIGLKEYLSNKIFDKCEAIAFNWLMYSDNGLAHYDKRPLNERSTLPRPKKDDRTYVKSIVRGNLDRQAFVDKKTNHRPVPEVKLCDSMGQFVSYYSDTYPTTYKYAYLKHFCFKSTEEYITKFLKGGCGGLKYNLENLEGTIQFYFKNNNFTEEKLKVFEKYFNRTFNVYHI